MRYDVAMKQFTSRSLEETEKIAADWLQMISKDRREAGQALIVGLSGHLGAGKTAFVKAVAKALGVTEEVTSPTFVIMKLYETSHPHWRRLVHIDAYRLEGPEELEALGFKSLTADPHNLIMIEWPENVESTFIPKEQFLHFSSRESAHKIRVQRIVNH